jgi:Acyl-ACP thioesterase
MFAKNYIISNNDVDERFDLKVSAIFRLFQDVAMLATRDLKVDSMSLSKRNIDWVITRMMVEIKRLPKCDEQISVFTYPGKDMAMLYPRYFFITDTKGEIIIRSSSIWCLIDNDTRKVVVDKEVIKKLPEESHESQLPFPEKVAMPMNQKYIERRTIHYSDLDFNSHMNNVRYIELLTDTHDSSFYKEHKITSITLNYLKEIKEKEVVDISSNASNPEIISVSVDGDLAFLGKVTYSD